MSVDDQRGVDHADEMGLPHGRRVVRTRREPRATQRPAELARVPSGRANDSAPSRDTDLVITLPHRPSGLSKATWTDVDFPSIGWHDCRVHAVSVGEYADDTLPAARMLLDLDYIVRWVQPAGRDRHFSVGAPLLDRGAGRVSRVTSAAESAIVLR
ncbi:hypothetical protein HCA58_22495 [Micromonospora sp. HNM0581]|uniref:hypothetical protein n=1 Tax=Micromonospora sp. HNM0581 TaxID=2716341 RepID=UPI00146B9CA2|nr:hypothetical protein [Micromonospora sp. HNM0581]NLU81063.1 hypothetical protein [Micromonospora sp. HNM0581]